MKSREPAMRIIITLPAASLDPRRIATLPAANHGQAARCRGACCREHGSRGRITNNKTCAWGGGARLGSNRRFHTHTRVRRRARRSGQTRAHIRKSTQRLPRLNERAEEGDQPDVGHTDAHHMCTRLFFKRKSAHARTTGPFRAQPRPVKHHNSGQSVRNGS